MSEQPATYTTCQEPHSSVELSTSTKGVVSYVVKVYAHDPDQARDEASRIFETLAQQYGRGGEG